jgi:ribosome-associated protein
MSDPGEDFSPEFSFQASRSSGAGGQHVNKVSSRVELRFNIPGSQLLSQDQKLLLLEKLAPRLTKQGELIIACDQSRSQFKNKRCCIAKFYDIISRGLTPRKKRHATKPTSASRLRRLDNKKSLSDKKQRRRPPPEF